MSRGPRLKRLPGRCLLVARRIEQPSGEILEPATTILYDGVRTTLQNHIPKNAAAAVEVNLIACGQSFRNQDGR